MDPNKALKELRELYNKVMATEGSDAEVTYELVSSIEALDNWLTRGGFLPADWQKQAKGGRQKQPKRGRRANCGTAPRASNPGMVHGSNALGLAMHQWHNGMDAVYGVGSYFVAPDSKPVPVERANDALDILKRIQRDPRPMPAASRRHLGSTIAKLEQAIRAAGGVPVGGTAGESIPRTRARGAGHWKKV